RLDSGGSPESHEARRCLRRRESGASAEEFLSPGQLDRSARTGSPAGGRTGGPQPGIVHGGKRHPRKLGCARKNRCVYQRKSEGAIFIGASCAHAASDGRGTLRRARGRPARERARRKSSRRKSAIRGKPGSKTSAFERRKYCGRDGA